MSIKRNSGKPSRKRNGDIPLMLNTNNKKFKDLMRENIRENITENIRETIRDEVKKFIHQIDFKYSDGTNHIVILNNLQEELTPREEEIMDLLIKKYSDSRIATTLGLGIYTVKNHMKNIRRKLGVKSRWEASDAYLKLHPEAEIEDKVK